MESRPQRRDIFGFRTHPNGFNLQLFNAANIHRSVSVAVHENLFRQLVVVVLHVAPETMVKTFMKPKLATAGCATSLNKITNLPQPVQENI